MKIIFKPLLVLLLTLIPACSLMDISKPKTVYFGNYKVPSQFQVLSPKKQNFKIDLTRENIVTGRKGTRLIIPEKAFDLDYDILKSGETADVNLTEIIDSYEMMSSGIPLEYINENGENVNFESAGMFDITAECNGKNLKLAEGKKIDILFPNTVPGDKFWVYHFENGKWVKDGHNQEGYFEIVSEKNFLGIRIYSISKLGRFNFDCPRQDSASVKWTISGGNLMWGAVIGVSVKGYFPCIYNEEQVYKTSYFQDSVVKIVLVSTDGKMAISDEFIMSGKYGHFSKQEGPDNFFLDIGNLQFRKVDKNILQDEKKFLKYLGIEKSEYEVDYSVQ